MVWEKAFPVACTLPKMFITLSCTPTLEKLFLLSSCDEYETLTVAEMRKYFTSLTQTTSSLTLILWFKYDDSMEINLNSMVPLHGS
jgi:hypothetical protein